MILVRHLIKCGTLDLFLNYQEWELLGTFCSSFKTILAITNSVQWSMGNALHILQVPMSYKPIQPYVTNTSRLCNSYTPLILDHLNTSKQFLFNVNLKEKKANLFPTDEYYYMDARVQGFPPGWNRTGGQIPPSPSNFHFF